MGIIIMNERVPDAVSAFTRVFDALWQRERAPGNLRGFRSADRVREWCTADPGPPRSKPAAVPGLQCSAAVRLAFDPVQRPRCTAPGTPR